MEKERVAHEAEEKEKTERMKKIKDQFADPNSQWEKDKTDIQNEALKEKKEKEKADAAAADAVAKSNPATAAKLETKAEVKAETKPESKAETKDAPKPVAKVVDPMQDKPAKGQ